MHLAEFFLDSSMFSSVRTLFNNSLSSHLAFLSVLCFDLGVSSASPKFRLTTWRRGTNQQEAWAPKRFCSLCSGWKCLSNSKKQNQTANSFFCGFEGDKTNSSLWLGCRVQTWAQVSVPAGVVTHLPIASKRSSTDSRSKIDGRTLQAILRNCFGCMHKHTFWILLHSLPLANFICVLTESHILSVCNWLTDSKTWKSHLVAAAPICLLMPLWSEA